MGFCDIEWANDFMDERLMRLKVMLLVSAVLAGCGGGGSDDVGQADQTFPEPAIFRAPLEPLPAATLTSEEDAVLLFNGWSYHYGSLMLIKDHTNNQMGNGVDVTGHEYRGCLDAGEYVTEGYSLEDLESPFTGALYNVRSYRLDECDYDLTTGGELTGFRQRGFPVSGEGSGDFFEETNFLSYDRYGDSSDQPHLFYQVSSLENSRMMRARYGYKFVHLARPDSETEYGLADSQIEEFAMERYAWIYDDSGEVTTIQSQLGKSANDRFSLSLLPNGDLPFPQHRIENASGAYGSKRSRRVRESCPDGLITLATLSDLVIDESDADLGPLSARRSIKSGQIELQDESGNKAVITMDGNAEVWSVSLNGQTSVDFSLGEIQALREARCG